MSDTLKTQRKPQNILILPKFQLKIMGYFLSLFLLTTLSLYSTSYLFFSRLNQKALNVGIPEGHVFFKFIANQKHDLDSFFVALAVVNFLLLIGVGLIISHRIAGPVYKLKKYLTEVERDSHDFRLREGDYFRDLEGPVNTLKDKLK